MNDATSNPLYSQNPINYSFAVGTSSIRVLSFNALRRRVIFHNPHTSANIALTCLVDQNGNALPAVINGAGAFMLVSLGTLELKRHPVSGFNAISDNAGGVLTIWEFF